MSTPISSASATVRRMSAYDACWGWTWRPIRTGKALYGRGAESVDVMTKAYPQFRRTLRYGHHPDVPTHVTKGRYRRCSCGGGGAFSMRMQRRGGRVLPVRPWADRARL